MSWKNRRVRRIIAHGDVVVIGDNFGVRITEIVGTKELMDSLSNM